MKKDKKILKAHPQKSPTLQYNYSHGGAVVSLPKIWRRWIPHRRRHPTKQTPTRAHSPFIRPKPDTNTATPSLQNHQTVTIDISTSQIFRSDQTPRSKENQKGEKAFLLNALFHFSFISIWYSKTVLPDRQFVEFTYNNTLDSLSKIKANIQNRKFCTP